MNDPQLAAALRSRSPDALRELLDACGDQLFSYCWYLLRNRENAQIAVRGARCAMLWWSLPRKSGAWFATNGSACGAIRWPVRTAAARGGSSLRCRRAGCPPEHRLRRFAADGLESGHEHACRRG